MTGHAARHSPGTAPENLITVRAGYAAGKGGLDGFYVAIGQAF